MEVTVKEKDNWLSKEEAINDYKRKCLLKEKATNESKIKELESQRHALPVISSDGVALTKSIDELYDRNDEIDKLLTSISVGTDQSISDFTYTSTEIEFSLGNLNGRGVIDPNNRRRIPEDLYNNTNCAQIVAEGETATVNDLKDNLDVIVTEAEDSIIFEDIQGISFATYSDDRDNLNNAFAHVHDVLIANAENKKSFEIIMNSKDPLTLSGDNIQATINSNLCGKAKRNAIIIVNKSGFAKLDIDVNGIALVTKDSNGDFIYKNKYVIKEVPDEILPNTENGESPIIIGDMSVVRFFILRESRLEKDDFFRHAMLDRSIRKEIIKLSTTSDEAYIHGLLA